MSGAEASVPEALFPERDPVFTEVANCCLQPIIICLLPAAHRSEVLIVLSMGKRLLRKKKEMLLNFKSTTGCWFTFWLADRKSVV